MPGARYANLGSRKKAGKLRLFALPFLLHTLGSKFLLASGPLVSGSRELCNNYTILYYTIYYTILYYTIYTILYILYYTILSIYTIYTILSILYSIL
jgi:hypothetical protein